MLSSRSLDGMPPAWVAIAHAGTCHRNPAFLQAAEGQRALARLDWESSFLFSWEVGKSRHLAPHHSSIVSGPQMSCHEHRISGHTRVTALGHREREAMPLILAPVYANIMAWLVCCACGVDRVAERGARATIMDW